MKSSRFEGERLSTDMHHTKKSALFVKCQWDYRILFTYIDTISPRLTVSKLLPERKIRLTGNMPLELLRWMFYLGL